MKRLIAIALCLVLGLSLFAGCGGKGGNTGTERPRVDEQGRTIITIGIPRSPLVEDYDTNKFTLWLEETTGHNIEFEYFSAVDAASQLSTRVNGGMQLPDILWGFELGSGVRSVYKDYGDSGFLIDLKEYFDNKEKSKNFWDLMEKAFPDELEFNHMLNRMTDQEHGAMYAFPIIETSAVDQMSYQVYINQQWLTNLKLEMPTDNESLLNVLRAFKTQDPNGNGKPDEQPLVATDTITLGGHGIGWLESLFLPTRMTTIFNLDENDQLTLPYTTEEYRKALDFISNLVEEGLLADSNFKWSPTQVTNQLNPADGVNTVGIFVGHPSVVFQYGQQSNLEYEALPLWSYAVPREPTMNLRYFITADCQDPDAAWDIFMAACSDEGAKRQRYGEKGVDWLEAEEGAKSYLGWDAEMILVNDIWGSIQNKHWGTVGATININAEGELCQIEDTADEWVIHKRRIMRDCYDYFQAAKEKYPCSLMPTILRNKEQADLLTVERTNCDNFIKEKRSQFCLGTGGADPMDETQWQNYLKELEAMGMAAYMEQNQEIYNLNFNKE